MHSLLSRVDYKRYMVAAFLLMLTTVAIYWPMLWFDLELEDYLVYYTSSIKETPSYYLRTAEWSNYFRPIEWLYYDVTYLFVGFESTSLYSLSIIHHALNSFLLLFFVKSITGNYRVALLAAILFACYPTSWEAVSWIVAAGHRLVATFLLLTMIVFWWFLNNPSISKLVALLFTVLIALSTREQAITLFPMIVILNWVAWVKRGKEFDKSLYIILFFMLVIYITYQFQLQMQNRLVESGKFSISYSTVVNFLALNLNIFIPGQLIKQALPSGVLSLVKNNFYPIMAFLTTILIVIGYISLRKAKAWNAIREYEYFYEVIFSLLFIPINLGIYSLFSGSGASSRYTYVASIGAALLFALIFEFLLQKGRQSKSVRYIGIGMIACMIALSAERKVWVERI